jgi:hypothetical protein
MLFTLFAQEVPHHRGELFGLLPERKVTARGSSALDHLEAAIRQALGIHAADFHGNQVILTVDD